MGMNFSKTSFLDGTSTSCQMMNFSSYRYLINDKNFHFLRLLVRFLCTFGHHWIKFWIHATGSTKHEELIRQLWHEWSYRMYQKDKKSLYGRMVWIICKIWFHTFRMLLVPDVFARYLVASFVLHIVYALCGHFQNTMFHLMCQITANGRKMVRLQYQLKKANTFQERQQIAGELDQLLGKDKWREDPASGLFLYERIINKTQMYKRLQLENDVMGIMFALRAGLLRKHWGIGHPRLYAVSKVGTKHIIEEYLDTIVQSMNVVLRATNKTNGNDDEKEELSIDNKLAFFSETRHSFGRSALLLSGGGSLGHYHAGVLKTLSEHNLLPTVISGASAGSIAAGMMGVRTDEEIADFYSSANHLDLNHLGINITKKDIQEYTPVFFYFEWLQQILPTNIYEQWRDFCILVNRWLDKGYLLDSSILRDVLRNGMGDFTFREAYDRTGRIINITVTPSKSNDYPHLLNYLTAPNVLIWSASLASCAIPWVFKPVELLAKDKNGNIVPYYREGLKWSDGSVECDLPMERLSELFNVNHFIVSQVNIHYKVVAGNLNNDDGTSSANLLSFLKKQLKAYIKNMAEFGLNTTVLKFLDIGLIPLLTQTYDGDITICPTDSVSWWRLWLRVLKNPTKEEFEDIMKAGERATWPFIPRIRTMCRIEFALERAVRYLRGEQAIQDEKKHGKKNLGRVPSFYTSPSSMNLASLDQVARTNYTSPYSSPKRSRIGSFRLAQSTTSPSPPDSTSTLVNGTTGTSMKEEQEDGVITSQASIKMMKTTTTTPPTSSTTDSTSTTTGTTLDPPPRVGSSNNLRRNKSVNVAGAVMTMEMAANTGHFGRYTFMDN